MSQCTVNVERGYKGTISGIVCARFVQRVTVSFRGTDNRIFSSNTFKGQGNNVPLTQAINPLSNTLAFGPFEDLVYIDVLIENSETGDNFSPSKVIQPITLSQKPDAAQPVDYRVSTIHSEDHVDMDFTDCVLHVNQYK